MRLTSFTDYGLRTLIRLAGSPDVLFTTDRISSEFAISRNHLAKVIQQLSRAGYIATQRGTGGGIKLAIEPDAVTIGEIVRNLEERHAIVECFRADGGTCTLTARCRLKGKLAAAREAFLKELDATTLRDCAYPSPEA